MIPRLLLFTTCLLVMACDGAVFVCDSASRTDVQAKVDLASDGDTVNVPAGSATWTSSVTITGKGITLHGEGIGQTIITDGTSSQALDITCSGAHFVRVTGMEFRSSGTHTSSGMIEVGGTMFDVGFRIDRCRLLISSAITRGIRTTGIYGLIDNCVFDSTASSGSIQMLSVFGSSDGTDGGYTPWARALTLGSTNAVYAENNVYTYGNQAEDCIDGYGGARVVIRNNVFHDVSVGFHGTDSGGRRSLFSFEIYGNAFTNNSSTTLRGATIRGGTGIICSNTYAGSRAWNGVTLMSYRACFSGTPLDQSNWGNNDGTLWKLQSATLSDNGSRICDVLGTVGFDASSNTYLGSFVGGFTNYFDGVELTNGYPGRDQVGRTFKQQLVPVGVWANGSVNAGTYDGGSPPPDGIDSRIAEGRDFTNVAVAFTPLAFPHPIASAQDAGPLTFILPVEVIGFDGTSNTVSFVAPAACTVTSIWMRVHHIVRQNMASISVNDAPWTNINNTTVTCAFPEDHYGGIGGGPGIVRFWFRVPTNAIVAGATNHIAWRHNRDVGKQSSGFRVLDFEVLSGGTNIISEDQEVYDNPGNWALPGGDWANGSNFWNHASLSFKTNSADPGTAMLSTLRCNNCHAEQARDLFHFNATVSEIEFNVIKLGGTTNDALDVATFIRSYPMEVNTNANLWNGVYQPGPGLDSQSVSNWDVGAGWSSVLTNDADIVSHLLPIDFTGTMNTREIPLNVQYPDWLAWLPEVWPGNATNAGGFGPDFATDLAFTQYGFLRNFTDIGTYSTGFNDWFSAVRSLTTTGDGFYDVPVEPWPLAYQKLIHALWCWVGVKEWELLNVNHHQEDGVAVFGSQSPARTWMSGINFFKGSHISHMVLTNNPFGDGNPMNYYYQSVQWYQVQATVDPGNRVQVGNYPIDWPYQHALAANIATSGNGSGGLVLYNLILAGQMWNNGHGPWEWQRGWNPWNYAKVWLLVPEPTSADVWKSLDRATRSNVVNQYVNESDSVNQTWIPSMYWTNLPTTFNGSLASPTETLNPPLDPAGGRWLDGYWDSIYKLRTNGVSNTRLISVLDEGKRIWPNVNWLTQETNVVRPSGFVIGNLRFKNASLP